jgi:hypothetical protein
MVSSVCIQNGVVDLKKRKLIRILIRLSKTCAIDDLDMSARYGDISGNLKWGLENFVHTPSSSEGIKQSGIKEKIIKFLQ